MRKRLLMDVDGVVANFSQHVIDYVGSSLTVGDITEWDIFGLIEKADGDQKKKIAYVAMEDPEFWVTLPVMEGALEGVKRLQKDYDLFWVTSPWPTCSGWDVSRRKWLHDNFNTSPDHVVITNSKFICSGNMFIDDKVSHIEEWSHYHPDGKALLFKAPYNSSCTAHEFFQW